MSNSDILAYVAALRRNGYIVDTKYDYAVHKYTITIISLEHGVTRGLGGTMRDAMEDLLKWEKQ